MPRPLSPGMKKPPPRNPVVGKPSEWTVVFIYLFIYFKIFYLFARKREYARSGRGTGKPWGLERER